MLTIILALWPTFALGNTIQGDYPKAGPGLAVRLGTSWQTPDVLSIMTTWKTDPPPGAGVCVGRVCTKKLSKLKLLHLLKNPDLSSADVPNIYFPRLDQAGALIGADVAHQKLGLSGQGILIAIIDTGIDWTHPDFIDEQGRTRIAWLLDLSLPPHGLHPDLEFIGRGAVFSSDEIQQALDSGGGPACAAGFDTMGHGTHVAGIAAGDDEVYTGIAPKARLVIVKAIDSESEGFSQDRILQALAFVTQIAKLESSPLVVNLSLGNQMGAHDGTEPIELALEHMSETAYPPCAVTVAAGNEGQQAIHARAALRRDGPALRMGLLLANTQQPTPSRPARVVLDFWWRGSSLDTVVFSPSAWSSDTIGPSESRWDMTSWSPDGLVSIVQAMTSSIHNGLHHMTITLSGESGSALKEGLWGIEFRGEASRIDGWIGEWDLGGWPAPIFTNHVDHDEIVGPPATARSVIAVGSMTGRTSWTSADGKDRSLADVWYGQLSSFTARGPTIDGRLKPELVAPGQAVASSMSSQADYRMPGSIFYSGGSMRKVMPDGIHAVSSGTSMAAPFVAGLCALAFERFPSITTGKQLHDRLEVSGASDSWTGGELFDGGWGLGKLNAMGLLDPTFSKPGNHMDPEKSLCGSSKHWLAMDPRQTVTISFIPRTSEGRNIGPGLQVNIDSDLGSFTSETVDHGNGLYTRDLCGLGTRGQALHVSCKLGSASAFARPVIILAASEQEADGGTITGGGLSCAYSHQAPYENSRSLIMLAILVCTLALEHRRRNPHND